MRILYFLLGLFFFVCSLPVFAQADEYISNPSFEDTPRKNHPPHQWFDCGIKGESAVDVHGIGPDFESAFFGVKEYAAHGQTFLGMVTRDNGTYEGISASLKQPLLADSTYQLTVMVNQSAIYKSRSRISDERVNFDSPVHFEIWGGNSFCTMTTLLVEYDIDEAGTWTELTYYITPEKDITFLSLYARQAGDVDMNGNMLVDNLQIVKVDAITLELPD